jgi:hypothetical protein
LPGILLPVTIFLSAFLLFQVQPMMGRYVLPWFGGGPAVWTACMLFYQAALLAGYAYAHWIGGRRPRTQTWTHIALLALSLAFLPAVPRAELWKTGAPGDPSGRILLLLAATIGGPYLALSATTPLLQRWFHVLRPAAPPWRLYALSNFGSFLALLSYPFLIEPVLRLRTQSIIWSALYVAFAAMCAWAAWALSRSEIKGAEPAVGASRPPAAPDSPAPSALDHLMWLALAACGSLLLLGTTSKITQEIAVVPFLWVVPLAIYLLTFVITFEHERWYPRMPLAVAAGILAPATCAVIGLSVAISVWKQLAVCLVALFVTCTLCHGELARSKPAPGYLTSFYLTIAAGGALGGIFAALIAPRIFTEYTEYLIALAASCVLGFAAWLRSGALAQWTGRNFAVRVPLMALMFGGLTSAVAAFNYRQPAIYAKRDFYGILRVNEYTQNGARLRRLSHGRVQHGLQFLDADKRDRPTTYYGPHSGVALAIDAVPHPRRVAVVGLGAGTLAAWGRPGDTYRFYEIDPNVEAIARHWFTFLSDSKAQTEVVLGDARVQLERELREGRSHDYDVIAVDAFSGDAIPIHLLTAECAEIYRQRLAPGGILALHISNRSLNLEPVTRGLARYLGWQARMVLVAPDLLDENPNAESSSRWVLLTEKRETFAGSKIRDTIVGWSTSRDPVITWTDDFASLWPILR